MAGKSSHHHGPLSLAAGNEVERWVDAGIKSTWTREQHGSKNREKIQISSMGRGKKTLPISVDLIKTGVNRWRRWSGIQQETAHLSGLPHFSYLHPPPFLYLISVLSLKDKFLISRVWQFKETLCGNETNDKNKETIEHTASGLSYWRMYSTGPRTHIKCNPGSNFFKTEKYKQSQVEKATYYKCFRSEIQSSQSVACCLSKRKSLSIEALSS